MPDHDRNKTRTSQARYTPYFRPTSAYGSRGLAGRPGVPLPRHHNSEGRHSLQGRPYPVARRPPLYRPTDAATPRTSGQGFQRHRYSHHSHDENHMMPHVRSSGYVPKKPSNLDHGEREAGRSAAAPLPETAGCSSSRIPICDRAMFSAHYLLDVKIRAELRIIRGREELPLEIIGTESRLRRALEYIWHCPACEYRSSASSTGREGVAHHIRFRHPEITNPNAAWQMGRNLKTHPVDIVTDILQAYSAHH